MNELNEKNIPEKLYKAYPRKWAEDFLEKGTIYFTNQTKFHNEKNPERCDPSEGTAKIIINGKVCQNNSICPIYIWCATTEKNPNTILDMWGDRDTVIQIFDTKSFKERIMKTISEKYPSFSFHDNHVIYDKDEGSYREPDLNDIIFQKREKYRNQKEYRFAIKCSFSENYYSIEGKDNIILSLGDCHDIAKIV